MGKISLLKSFVLFGLDAHLVDVEVDVSNGLPSFNLVGLPDKAVEESKERVRAAIKNSGFDFPAKRITVNLAPADIKKEGGIYDLPIALGILIASGHIDEKKFKDFLICGELSLSGNLRAATSGVIQAAILAREKKLKMILPVENASEAGLVDTLKILPIGNLQELFSLSKEKELQFIEGKFDSSTLDSLGADEFDFANIKGLILPKRALEIAAAGAHNVLFSGAPGGGKTMLARSIVSILPRLEEGESIEITKIYSASGLLNHSSPLITYRPFRAPHHSISKVAIIGGGTIPKPGEITLAHRGVLFLDEIAEFPRNVLESLRQPLEDKIISISRARGTIDFPADFMLLAARNPCPCGNAGSDKECSCSMSQIIAYNKRISGPLLDRFDINFKVEKIPFCDIKKSSGEEPSSKIRKRVECARLIQAKRSQKNLGRAKTNSLLSQKELEKLINIDAKMSALLEQAVEKFDLSMRGYVKILRLALTIADLEDKEVKLNHVVQALQFRGQTKGDYE
ncbi:magnesium chelatase [Candidatus Berkelbacteria bacterium CG10_big_fil_rev_8_21_14_0_10_41_12]|uniref:Magnesium chelatase n=1 Tax=Candidatus Berkelbacteria bacterium CG10_big_fil_rev_8_21_14_0_10_41_12 TaxID=1974513 RepID=A0A2M6WX93_9BACT|nr:MAG: magnesium chelatase [Candidatus Berkelbacteria bacterium CG10_big_fil_rev_8_21_14_0_10_41_12]